MGNYKVYYHQFPDGKRYVGCTGGSLRQRWNGGLGYADQDQVFLPILNAGWDKIEHYVVADHLDRDVAHEIEALLIRRWKTYNPRFGYNKALPKINNDEAYRGRHFCGEKIDDCYTESVETRYARRIESGTNVRYGRTRMVRIKETGEVFNSVFAAARSFGVSASCLSQVLSHKSWTCGKVWITDEEEGWSMEVPAHWEYID